MNGLQFPPIAEGFLQAFGPGVPVVKWQNEQLGLFVVYPPGVRSDTPPVLDVELAASTPSEVVVETPSVLELPCISPEDRSGDPPVCFHQRPARTFTCKRENANHGRVFYTCGWAEGKKCSFFRWQDENSEGVADVQTLSTDQYSEITMRPTLRYTDMQEEVGRLSPSLQLQAWAGLKQGTEEWLRLRACRPPRGEPDLHRTTPCHRQQLWSGHAHQHLCLSL